MGMFKYLLLPPGMQLILLFVALILWFRCQPLSLLLLVIASISLYLLSTGVVSNALMRSLEGDLAIVPVSEGESSHQSAQAIVILGTGVLCNTPEYDFQPQPGPLLNQRLLYSKKLATATGLPILVTGGNLCGVSEADVMEQSLAQFGVPVKWQERESLSTFDNARYSANILRQEGIKHIYLVSHAWHLKRACLFFKGAGLDCTPAPTAFAGNKRSFGLRAWLPDVRELRKSQLAINEYWGILQYKLSH